MGSQDNARSEVPFAQFILNSNLFGGELTEDEQRGRVDTAATRLAVILEEVTPQSVFTNGGERIVNKIDFQIFRSRGIRGQDGEAPLPSGDLWGLQLFIRPIEVLETS